MRKGFSLDDESNGKDEQNQLITESINNTILGKDGELYEIEVNEQIMISDHYNSSLIKMEIGSLKNIDGKLAFIECIELNTKKPMFDCFRFKISDVENISTLES